MLNKDFETKVTEVGNNRKILQVCMLIQQIPIVAATFSLGKKRRVGNRLGHEFFVPIPKQEQKSMLEDLHKQAKGTQSVRT